MHIPTFPRNSLLYSTEVYYTELQICPQGSNKKLTCFNDRSRSVEILLSTKHIIKKVMISRTSINNTCNIPLFTLFYV